MENNMSNNDDKSFANCIMGLNVFIVMGITKEMNTYKIDGICAHTFGEAYN
jgi:hypothetical protein